MKRFDYRPKNRFALLAYWAVVLAVVISPLLATAGPTVIRDERVTDLSVTPVLGRGYSIATNTYQSACLKEVVITEPSYDFKFDFHEFTSKNVNDLVNTREDNPIVAKAWSFVTDQVTKVTGLDLTQRTDGPSSEKSTKQTHFIAAFINVSTYYASVDEAATPLSDNAAELLTEKDIPGFFASCGPYYVRGINRDALFVALFTLEATTKEEMKVVSTRVRDQLLGFNLLGSVKESAGTFKTKSSKMRILTRAWGLGKNEEASLIATNVEEFKQSVKAAFTAMQKPSTGRVSSVELVPWVENTDFQAKLKMRGQDKVDGVEVPLYEKKDIITFNGEFLAEMNRASRARLNRYYKARLCRNAISEKYWDDKMGIAFRYRGQRVKNHRTLEPGVTLEKLNRTLTDRLVQNLFDKDYMDFQKNNRKANYMGCVRDLLFTEPPPLTPGASPEERAAAESQAQLQGKGLYLKRWTDHKVCRTLQKEFVPPVQPAYRMFENHCMPQLMTERAPASAAGDKPTGVQNPEETSDDDDDDMDDSPF